MNEQEIKTAVQQALQSVSTVTLAQAKKLIAKVEEEAARIGVAAVVAVANSGAHPIAVECMDHSFIASYDIAVQKTYTSVSLKMSTKDLKRLSQPGQPLYGIPFTNQGKIVIFGGGEPLLCCGHVIGALGVSGGTEAQDTYLAEFGKQVFEEEIL